MYNFKGLRQASQKLARLSAEERTGALQAFARLLELEANNLIEASAADVKEQGEKLSSANRARLVLNKNKLSQVITGIRHVATLPDSVGAIQKRTLLDDNLILERVAVPLGVFGIIFESRADVAPQILSLAIRSANAVVLKGGSETRRVNSLYAEIAAKIPGLPEGWFQMYHERGVVEAMLNAYGEIDLLIPRGSNALVQSIIEKSRIPVLGHADGVCHIYVHHTADIDKALGIVIDAKANYPAACNALETVLVDSRIADRFLPLLVKRSAEAKIELRGGTELRKFLPDAELVQGEQWHAEYGELILAVKVVEGVDSAMEHINTYGSHHTDCILAQDSAVIERFLTEVDSANVYANCSTRFADGFRYGLGAEIGISTGRVHARGPVGIEGLMTYKYKLRGQGQTVADYMGERALPFKHKRLPLE